MRYLVTTHEHLPGARLSKLGHWGNVPHPDVEAAEGAARLDANGAAVRIAREDFPSLPAVRPR